VNSSLHLLTVVVMAITMATAAVKLLVAAHIVSITAGRGKLSRLSGRGISRATAESLLTQLAGVKPY